jgi:hypothetical protein
VPSTYEPTPKLRELLIKRTFSGECAPNEGKENILQYVIHCNLGERASSCTRRGVRPTSLGV